MGGCAGLALGCLGLIQVSDEHARVSPATAGLYIAGGFLFGLITGYDLFGTRDWKFLGKYTLIPRAALSCSSAAAVTALLGSFLGVVARSEIWKYALGGAAAGALIALKITWNPVMPWERQFRESVWQEEPPFPNNSDDADDPPQSSNQT